MADRPMTFQLHHSGQFTKTKYVGGSVVTYANTDMDSFSYPVLMEWVKDLNYDEIGGIYVSKEKNGGWTLVTNDSSIWACIAKTKGSELHLFIDCDVDKEIPPMKQMQPHVIVRPRKCPVKVKEKIAEKRKFVTLRDINQEKERKLSTRKKLQFGSTATSLAKEGISSKAAMEEDSESHVEGIGLGEYLRQFEIRDEGENVSADKNSNENMVEKTHESQGVNQYEMDRNKRVAEIKRKAMEMGLTRLSDLSLHTKDKRKVTNDESDNYCPDNDGEQQNTDEDDMVTSKRIKKAKGVEVGMGPRTRSRANKVLVNSYKEPNEVEVDPNDTPVVPTVEKLKLSKDKAPGSMTRYLELRDRQKNQAQIEILQSQSQNQTDKLATQKDAPSEPKKIKRRGKSKMNHVHTRSEKREITLNDLGQPVSADDRVSELSNFLGTTVRDFVSLTCVSWHEVPEKDILWEYVKDKYIIPEEGRAWVMTTMRDQFRGFKSNIKKNHYLAYETDEERMKHRPREVPEKDFRVLLQYWADEKVQATAKRNAESRSLLTETHTAGPKSFAQVSNKLLIEKIEKMPAGAEEPPAQVMEAEIFVETRKRDMAREYKLPTKEIQEKVSNVQKILNEGGTIEAANQLVHGGKKHTRSYLLGRLIRKRQPQEKSAATPASSISDKYLEDLTERIREQLAHEMEEKVDKKVREKVKSMMTKIAEKNPELKVDTDELNGEPSTDVLSDNVST